MSKCNFNKQSNFFEITLRHGCSPAKLLYLVRIAFCKNISGVLLLVVFKTIINDLLYFLQYSNVPMFLMFFK